MKVLIQGYNTCHQNIAGGVSKRIVSFMDALNRNGVDCKIFDYWNDRIEDYDIIHFFKVQSEHYSLANYLTSKNKPYVISSIVPIEKRNWIRLNCWLDKLKLHTLIGMNREFMNNASFVVTESLQEKKYIEECYGINKIKIRSIPNGVYLNEDNVDKNLFLNKFHVTDGFVLCVGRIDPNKNQLNLIKALNNTNIQLVIIGGPDPQNTDYFERCKVIADSNVIFTGWIPDSDILLKAAYQSAKVVVLPSFKETFGNVILEGAISHSNISFNKDLVIKDWGIDNYAYTFNPNNIQTIRNAVEKAYYSSVNSELFDFVRKEFTWDAVAQKYIELYKQLL